MWISWLWLAALIGASRLPFSTGSDFTFLVGQDASSVTVDEFLVQSLPTELTRVLCLFGLESTGGNPFVEPPSNVDDPHELAGYSARISECVAGSRVNITLDGVAEQGGSQAAFYTIRVDNSVVDGTTLDAALTLAYPAETPGPYQLQGVVFNLLDEGEVVLTTKVLTTTTTRTSTVTTETRTETFAIGESSLWSEFTDHTVYLTVVGSVGVFVAAALALFCLYERQMHIEHAEQYLQELHRAQNPRLYPEYKAFPLSDDSPSKIVESIIGYDSRGHSINKPAINPKADTSDGVSEVDKNNAPVLNELVSSEVKSLDAAKQTIIAAVAEAMMHNKDYQEFVAWKAKNTGGTDDNEDSIPCPKCKVVGGHMTTCSESKRKTRHGSTHGIAFERFQDSVVPVQFQEDKVPQRTVLGQQSSSLPSAPPHLVRRPSSKSTSRRSASFNGKQDAADRQQVASHLTASKPRLRWANATQAVGDGVANYKQERSSGVSETQAMKEAKAQAKVSYLEADFADAKRAHQSLYPALNSKKDLELSNVDTDLPDYIRHL